MDPNYDPRDETHSRPQVAFRLRADAYDTGEFFRDLTRRVPTCHDLMVFDAKNGEVPGTIRFGPSGTQQVVAFAVSLPPVNSGVSHHAST